VLLGRGVFVVGSALAWLAPSFPAMAAFGLLALASLTIRPGAAKTAS
jgi:hypothetical protein